MAGLRSCLSHCWRWQGYCSWLCTCVSVRVHEARPRSCKTNWITETKRRTIFAACVSLCKPSLLLLTSPLNNSHAHFAPLCRLPYLTRTCARPTPPDECYCWPGHTGKQRKHSVVLGAGALIISPAGNTDLAASFSPSIFTSSLFIFKLWWLAARERFSSRTV